MPYDRKKLANKVDSILDSKEIITKLPKLLNNKKLKIKNCPSCHEADKLKIRNINIIYIPIMYGCNNFCSYCAVPYTRGREVSRSEKDILSEIKSSTKNSSGKIMLLGQNVNSYQQSVISCQKKLNTENCNLKTGSDFVDLLNKIEKIESVKEITFMTSHPKDVSEKLINWMASSKKFSRELHLPLQSGDDNILKKMNRHYTANQYLNLINSIRKKVNISFLSTDIIVGFPGETENQFKNTFNICMEIVFDKAYISQYSPRPGTIAVKMEDDIPLAKKKRRWKILDNLINKKG